MNWRPQNSIDLANYHRWAQSNRLKPVGPFVVTIDDVSDGRRVEVYSTRVPSFAVAKEVGRVIMSDYAGSYYVSSINEDTNASTLILQVTAYAGGVFELTVKPVA